MLEVREAVVGDARQIAEVHVRAWQVGYEGQLPGAFLDSLRPEERMARYRFGADAPEQETIVALEDAVVRGFAVVGTSGDADVAGFGELYAIYVDPERWGGGVGRRLIAEARRRLVAAGHRSAVLWVLDGNARAERFYLADGWQRDGATKTMAFGGSEVDVVRYRRVLP